MKPLPPKGSPSYHYEAAIPAAVYTLLFTQQSLILGATATALFENEFVFCETKVDIPHWLKVLLTTLYIHPGLQLFTPVFQIPTTRWWTDPRHSRLHECSHRFTTSSGALPISFFFLPFQKQPDTLIHAVKVECRHSI